MRAVHAAWSRARAELRASRRTAIALIVVAGLAGGVVLAAAAAARRTWAALPELLAYHQPEDAVVFLEGGLSAAEQEELFAQVADLPMVVDASRTAIVPLTELGPGGEALESELTARVVLDGPSYDRLARPLIVAGRHPRPDQAEEVAVDESLAARRGLEPGDGLEVRLEPGGPPLRLTVTGVERQPYDISAGTGAEAAPAGAHEGDDLYLTPAFWDRHRPGTVTDGVTPDSVAPDSVAMAVWLEEGAAGVDAFTEAAATVADESVLFVEPGAQDLEGVPALQRAIDVQAAALAAFAALGAVATVVILGQALSRQVVLDAADRRTLTALGMTRAQLVGAGLVRTGLIGIGAGVLAVMVAVALSPLAPIGLARRAELDPGVEVDGAVLAPGAVLLVVSLTAWGLVAAVGATRPWDPLGRSPGTTAAPSRLAERLARGNLPVPLVTGVRMALGPGQGQASVPVRTAVAGVQSRRQPGDVLLVDRAQAVDQGHDAADTRSRARCRSAGYGLSKLTHRPSSGWAKDSRTACSHCRSSPRRLDSVGSAPYVMSPTQGCRSAAMCTRIWWVRPVSRWISSSVACRNASIVS